MEPLEGMRAPCMLPELLRVPSPAAGLARTMPRWASVFAAAVQLLFRNHVASFPCVLWQMGHRGMPSKLRTRNCCKRRGGCVDSDAANWVAVFNASSFSLYGGGDGGGDMYTGVSTTPYILFSGYGVREPDEEHALAAPARDVGNSGCQHVLALDPFVKHGQLLLLAVCAVLHGDGNRGGMADSKRSTGALFCCYELNFEAALSTKVRQEHKCVRIAR